MDPQKYYHFENDEVNSSSYKILRNEIGELLLDQGEEEIGLLISKRNDSTLLRKIIDPEIIKVSFGVAVESEFRLALAGISAARFRDAENSTQECSTSNAPRKNRADWTRGAILSLIEIYKQYEGKIDGGGLSHEKIAKLVSDKLSAEGFSFTATQCKDKYLYLKQRYHKQKDNMDSRGTGEAPVEFEYFEELNKYLGNKPNVLPVATASSLRGLTFKKHEMNEVGETLEPQSTSTSQTSKRKREEDNVERRHRERIERQDRALDHFDRFLTLLEKSMIDKNK